LEHKKSFTVISKALKSRSMTNLILLTLALYFVQVLLPPAFDYVFQGKFMQGMGSRDNPPPATVQGARARRALTNLTENMILFLPLAILAIVLGKANGLALSGALIFLLARVAYVPLYLFGVPALRSGVWSIGLIGLFMMAAALL